MSISFIPSQGIPEYNSSNKNLDEQPTLLGCFHPQAEVKVPQPGILKQKAGIPAQCFPHPQHQTGIYFPQPERCHHRRQQHLASIHHLQNVIAYACITRITFSFILRASLQNALHTS